MADERPAGHDRSARPHYVRTEGGAPSRKPSLLARVAHLVSGFTADRRAGESRPGMPPDEGTGIHPFRGFNANGREHSAGG
ncbi:hypothetical protein [Kitasatospora sp. KL5]|uniref:hypothetical protein n=1 Tax=Kitasatospora sp. KL5 TaxID=3425125 RepID=UPI003D6EB3D9